MPEAGALNKIKQGGGKMPSFAGVINGHEEGIIDYLFDKTEKQLSQKERDLLEIQNNRSSNVEVKKDKATRDTATTYLNITAYAQLKDPEGHPAIKPPWGTLNAINLNTGDYAWTIPVGTGSPGPIATGGGLVFLGGARDRKFQAFDKATGKLLWEITLPGIASSTPCTYSSNGKQYVAVSVAGNKENPAGSIMAFALPD